MKKWNQLPYEDKVVVVAVCVGGLWTILWFLMMTAR